eukprot:GILJ01000862.1.p1 GENE.GILJ01000862.1~~GILJ01000862.1.p1  ORF type:complete len:456 (+),score=102.97 GILJ01000862.1:136-1503(+)
MTSAAAAQSAYSFSSKPRTVAPGKKKYREPSDGEEQEKKSNIMHDKRVFRGNTYNLSVLEKSPTSQEKPATTSFARPVRKAQVEHKSIFDITVRPPSRVEVDLSEHLNEKVEPKVEVDECEQTDIFQPRPVTPPYIPKKTGIDASTQIQEGELFDFNFEVRPIVDVLVLKTLEQALMEVEEEDELSSIQSFKDKYHEKQQQTQRELDAMVERERMLLARKEQRVREERDRVQKEQTLVKKLSSLKLSRQYLETVTNSAFRSLYQSGFYPDNRKQVIEQAFMPWLFSQVDKAVHHVDVTRQLVDAVIQTSINGPLEQHATVLNDKRKEEAKAEEERKKKKSEVLKGNIRIFVNGLGYDNRPIGPIQVTSQDPVSLVEERIFEWLAEHAPQVAAELPYGLQVYLNQKPLQSTSVLFNIKDLGSVEIKRREVPLGQTGDSQADQDENDNQEEDEEEDV